MPHAWHLARTNHVDIIRNSTQYSESITFDDSLAMLLCECTVYHYCSINGVLRCTSIGYIGEGVRFSCKTFHVLCQFRVSSSSWAPCTVTFLFEKLHCTARFRHCWRARKNAMVPGGSVEALLWATSFGPAECIEHLDIFIEKQRTLQRRNCHQNLAILMAAKLYLLQPIQRLWIIISMIALNATYHYHEFHNYNCKQYIVNQSNIGV